MHRLWLLVALAGCSGGSEAPPPGDPDAAATPDGALPDADLPDANLPDAMEPPLTGDILSRLQQLPGMTVVERTDLVPMALAGYRYFHLTYVQPVDQLTAGGATFTQRLTLLHRADDAPVVVQGGGYHLAATPTPSRAEPTRILEANQISIEHRFFTPSRPDPADWSFLTIRQSAGDYHRIIEAGHRLYPSSRFLVTGASKGGETAVFHRRYYPADVDGTVAYVAPLALGAPDARFVTYLAAIGPQDCRDAMAAFQRNALDDAKWHPALVTMVGGLPGVTWNHLGLERAIEHAILETPFALWQYSGVASCANIPGPAATAQAAFDFIDARVSWAFFSDASVDRYGPYYYQAAVELGFPLIDESAVDDLVEFPGTDIASVYSPPGIPTVFAANAMMDIQSWVETEGSSLMFIYGSNDPWSAAKFELGAAVDSYRYIVDGGNHGANIAQLPTAERNAATATVQRWGGVTPKRASFGRPGEAAVEMPRRPR
jgi:hypothetical protein